MSDGPFPDGYWEFSGRISTKFSRLFDFYIEKEGRHI